MQQFITNNAFNNAVIINTKDKQPVLRIGIFKKKSLPSDRSATLQWKLGKKPQLVPL
jgi:hypothetical protein